MLSRVSAVWRTLFAVSLMTNVCATTPACAQTPAAKVALLVGVNQYDKRYFADRPLQYAERDVEAMSDELQKHGFAVQLLKGSLTGEGRAVKANIDAALSKTLTGRNFNDIVLIGFAGHGQQAPLRNEKREIMLDAAGNQLEDAYYCPADSEFGNPDSMISLTRLIQTLDTRGGVNLLLVDACRDNPDPTRGVRSISGNELNGRLPRNTALLFSCAAGQQALETDLAGGGHGVFFHHVLKGLQGEAKNSRGEVTWSRLVEYVGDNTNPQAKEWFPERVERAVNGFLQTPHELRNLIGNPVLARVAIAPVVVPPNNSPSNNMPVVSPPVVPNGGPTPPRSPDEITNSIGMKLKLIPAGEFMMGSPADEKDRSEDEGPQHRVKISQPFYMGVHEVTKRQFAQFVNATGHKTDAEKDGKGGWGLIASGSVEQDPNYTWRNAGFAQGDDHPVVNVSWNDATAFCAWLSQKDGATYKLPSEAQWEYACRAGTNTPFHFGSVNNGKQANSDGNSPYGTETKGPYLKRTTSVGSYQANAFGLFDMHGNVWEWCQDGYDYNAYKNLGDLTSDPVNNSIASYRVLRGGAWLGSAGSTRSAVRLRYAPDFRGYYAGFRVLRTP